MTVTTKDFYLLRAAECARDAELADLANVRDRFRRAESVWRGLAQRIIERDKL